ncbi:MAG: CxxxxCH/CxxCH domain-containing protein [Planctomycetota bacterium]|nr:MAG: CxxxxCH/CxxCH domain-containing protein [Planctomycetota bacterium]
MAIRASHAISNRSCHSNAPKTKAAAASELPPPSPAWLGILFLKTTCAPQRLPLSGEDNGSESKARRSASSALRTRLAPALEPASEPVLEPEWELEPAACVGISQVGSSRASSLWPTC